MKRDSIASKFSHSPMLSYTTGFILSLVLTLIPYWLVVRWQNVHHYNGSTRPLVAALLTFALMQLIVQLVFFLHLGREAKPRWNLWVLMFTVLVVTILVAGSIWIMINLDYHHDTMTPAQTDSYIIKDEGFSN